MTQVDKYFEWDNVVTSLTAAGVDIKLAYSIVDILKDDRRRNPKKFPHPLVIIKSKMVDSPLNAASEMEPVEHLTPRLFSIMQNIVTEPNRKRKHAEYAFMKCVISLERDQF